MSTSTIKNLPKSTVELEIHIPWNEIKETYDETLKTLIKDAELPGFRKGKAPQKIVEEKIDKNKLYEEVIRKVIPKTYTNAISTHKLTPIVSPKIEIIKAKLEDEWVVKVTVSLKPAIKLKNYKDKIKELKKAKVKIWIPGQKENKDKENKITLDEIIDTLTKEIEVELSDQLISQEANRLLSDLIDRTRTLGLTIEQYVISKGKTIEQLKSEYAETARKNLTLEFALAEIADTENIIVSKEDIDDLLNKVKSDEERQKLAQDSYYLAHLLRQQKTIDFLTNL